MNYKLKISLIITLLLASCRTPDGIYRPTAPLCTIEGDTAECTDGRGDFEVDPRELLCTTNDGYKILESYIDTLELEIKSLKLKLRSCKK